MIFGGIFRCGSLAFSTMHVIGKEWYILGKVGLFALASTKYHICVKI